MYTEYVPAEGIEIGFASPGVDEAMLVTDVISELEDALSRAHGAPGLPRRPALAAFHVGITRVEGDELRGAAVARIRELLEHLGQVALASATPDTLLVAGISAGLFEDIRAECGFTGEWRALAVARAHVCCYLASATTASHREIGGEGT